ncbi:MAG TPA: hypothetical protein VD995_04650 [Azospirillum sp.]|nr:hypothetical protein [Azospirillum sp.]
MFNQRGAPPRPVRGYSESAEAYLDRLGPWLDQVAGGGGGAAGVPDVYDTSGRVIFSGRGLYAYAADGSLPIAPNVVQIDTQHLVDAAVELAKLDQNQVVTCTPKLIAGDIVTLSLLAGDLEAVEARINNLRVNRANIANAAIGSAQIEDLAVTNAKIADLAADKITAGTLNAALITVINLSADSITTGTLVADRIAAGSITTGKVASNAITQTAQGYVATGNAITTTEGLVMDTSLTTVGGPVMVSVGYVASLQADAGSQIGHFLRLARYNGSSETNLVGPSALVANTAQDTAGDNRSVSLTIIDTPPAGTYAYRVYLQATTSPYTVSDAFYKYISVVELKR